MCVCVSVFKIYIGLLNTSSTLFIFNYFCSKFRKNIRTRVNKEHKMLLSSVSLNKIEKFFLEKKSLRVTVKLGEKGWIGSQIK